MSFCKLIFPIKQSRYIHSEGPQLAVCTNKILIKIMKESKEHYSVN